MADFSLNLNINGVDTAINSIDQLEEALKASKEGMKSLAFGSEAFTQAAGNVQKLESSIKNVKLATEGVNTKQLAKSFADLGQTVAGAFAIASNAGELFGSKNEDLAKAQIKAQQAIAIVMGARAVAEGIVEGKAAARLIVEKAGLVITGLQNTLLGTHTTALVADTTATEGATVAQTGLNAAMSANPIGLVIAALAALAAAFYAFSPGAEDAEEAEAALNAELAKTKELMDQLKLSDDFRAQIQKNNISLTKAQGATNKEVFEEELKLLQIQETALERQYQARTKNSGALLKTLKDANVEEIRAFTQLQQEKDILQAQFNTNEKKAKDDQNKKDSDALGKKLDEEKQKKEKNNDLIRQLEEEHRKILTEIAKASTDSNLAKLAIDLENEKIFVRNKYKNAVGGEELLKQTLLEIDKKYETLARAERDKDFAEANKEEIERLQKSTVFYSKLNEDRAAVQLATSKLGKTKLEQLELDHTARLLQIEKEKNDRIAEITKIETDKNGKITADGQKRIDEVGVKGEEDAANKKLLVIGTYNEQKKALLIQSQQEDIASFQKYASAVGTVVNDVVAIFSAVSAGRKQALDQELVDLDNANIEREDKYNQDYNNQKKALDAQYSNGTLSKSQYDKAIATLQKKKDDDDKKAAAKLLAEKNAIRKLEFENDKKMKTASTVINTIMGAIAAFTGMAQAIPGPYGLIAGGIAATAVTVAGAIAVANIQKTQFNEEKGPPTSIDTSAGEEAAGAVGGANQIAQASSGGFTGFSPNAVTPPGGSTGGQGSQGGNQPQKVYVLESDITDAQRKVSLAESNSTFG